MARELIRLAGVLVGGRLSLGLPTVQTSNTEVLRSSKLKAKNRGDLTSAVLSAGYYAAKTGKTMYSVEGLPTKATGTLTYADGMLYLLSDHGTVALMPPSPESFNIVSQFQLPEGDKEPAWAHPVVCGGRLYLRHRNSLYAYGVRPK